MAKALIPRLAITRAAFALRVPRRTPFAGALGLRPSFSDIAPNIRSVTLALATAQQAQQMFDVPPDRRCTGPFSAHSAARRRHSSVRIIIRIRAVPRSCHRDSKTHVLVLHKAIALKKARRDISGLFSDVDFAGLHLMANTHPGIKDK